MRTFSFLLLIMSFMTRIFATPLCHIQRYDESDGLTQWHITQMIQDHQGMMWFSTWNGICRYDGYEFKGFKGHIGDNCEIATDRVRNMWLNDDGNIGCRIDDELFIFNLKTYFFEKKKNLKQNLNHAFTIKSDKPYRIKDKQGIIWTIYQNGMLSYQMPNGKEMPYQETSIPEQTRLCLPDKQGNLWVASTKALYKINFLQPCGTIKRYTQEADTKAIFIDHYHRYWVTMKGENTISIYDKDNHLLGYLSNNGEITKNISRFNCPIYCISQTHDGTIWLGSKPGGLFRLKEQRNGMAYNIEKINNMPCNNIYDIKEDHWGRLWIATLGEGIFCITNPMDKNPIIATPQKDLKGYPLKLAQKVRNILITNENILLAATTDGLIIAKLLPTQNLKNIQFNCHVREANREDALSCSATMNVIQDKHGRFFISTESGGINMITSKDPTLPSLSFKHYNKMTGLPSDIALSVTPYGNDLLIISSNSIIILDPIHNTSMAFGKNQFFTECRFSDAIPKKLPNSEWMFGLQDGTININMSQMQKDKFVPNIAFTDISIQGIHRDIAINALDTLILTDKERNITISFAALDYSFDAHIRYQFALIKGNNIKNAKWNDIGMNHSTTLLDLIPGTYTLLIKSTNSDGIWVDNVRKLTIIVTPKFSETKTALLLFLLIIALCLGGIVYTILYVRKVRKQRHEALEAYLALLQSGKHEEHSKTSDISKKLSEEDDKLLRKVSAFVEKHLSDSDVSISDMAESAAVSRSGLQRKMKQIVGVTPLDFLKEARIKQACHLLATTSKSISEIAFACGFSDPKYFSRTFKSSTGKSPKDWRGQQNIIST